MVDETGLVERRYLLLKRGLYYRPDNCGYTGIKDNAGRYLASDARPQDGVTAIHEDEAPMYTEACFDDIAKEHAQATIEALQQEVAELVADKADLADVCKTQTEVIAELEDQLRTALQNGASNGR